MLSRNRWLATAAFLAVFLPSAAWVWTIKPTYEAAASLMVKGETAALAPAEMMAEVESLKARPVLGRVVGTLDLIGNEPGVSEEERIEKAVMRLRESLRVGSLPQSGAITIQYGDKDPKVAADVVNTLAALYIDRHASRRRVVQAQAKGDDELRGYEQELQRARDELAQFRKRNQSALLATQKDAAKARSEQLAADLQRLDAQLHDAEGKLDGLRSRGAGAAASAEERGRVQLQVDGLRNRRTEVLEQLRGAEGWRSQLERLAARHAELEAAVSSAEQNYILYQEPKPDQEALAASPAGRLLTVSLVRRAEAPEAPLNDSQRPWLLLLGAFAALGAALAAVVLFEPSQRPVSHVADIASSVSAPVLMMIQENQSHVS